MPRTPTIPTNLSEWGSLSPVLSPAPRTPRTPRTPFADVSPSQNKSGMFSASSVSVKSSAMRRFQFSDQNLPPVVSTPCKGFKRDFGSISPLDQGFSDKITRSIYNSTFNRKDNSDFGSLSPLENFSGKRKRACTISSRAFDDDNDEGFGSLIWDNNISPVAGQTNLVASSKALNAIKFNESRQKALDTGKIVFEGKFRDIVPTEAHGKHSRLYKIVGRDDCVVKITLDSTPASIRFKETEKMLIGYNELLEAEKLNPKLRIVKILNKPVEDGYIVQEKDEQFEFKWNLKITEADFKKNPELWSVESAEAEFKKNPELMKDLEAMLVYFTHAYTAMTLYPLDLLQENFGKKGIWDNREDAQDELDSFPPIAFNSILAMAGAKPEANPPVLGNPYVIRRSIDAIPEYRKEAFQDAIKQLEYYLQHGKKPVY